MKALLTTGAALATAVAIAACGGSGSSAAKGSDTTVSARTVNGASVLVDSAGKALYAPAQEKGGKIMCTGSCTSIWMPLTIASGKPTGPGNLGTVKRPGGKLQVTAGGRPLYTFAQDQTGTVNGNGANDMFGGRSFTWHVITSKGTPKAASSSGGTGGAY
jgi:predicted lipoprotein with Yx(FWY)xxD motif